MISKITTRYRKYKDKSEDYKLYPDLQKYERISQFEILKKY